MFKDIKMSDYNIRFELHWSYFLRDCLREEISFEYENRPKYDTNVYPRPQEKQVIIHKKSDNGISEEISLDELIFYIHTTTAYIIDRLGPTCSPAYTFKNIFYCIDNIKKAVDNMTLLFKYDKDFNKDIFDYTKQAVNEELNEGEPLMTEISTKQYNSISLSEGDRQTDKAPKGKEWGPPQPLSPRSFPSWWHSKG